MQALKTGYIRKVPDDFEEESEEELANYTIFFMPYDLSSDNRLKCMEIQINRSASIRELR